MINKLIFNLGFWLFIWLIFAFSMMRFEPLENSTLIASIIVFPLIIPVYIHNFLFNYFFICYKCGTRVLLSGKGADRQGLGLIA